MSGPGPQGVTDTKARIEVSETSPADWDDFVRARERASIYLRSGWSNLARDVFGHQVYFIFCRDEAEQLRGVLPLVQQRTFFGNFATSVPFFNYGGALADDPEVASALMIRARDLAASLGCSYLEMRDVDPQPGDWIVRTDKACMVIGLPGDADALGKKLGSKLRSQIKRAEREDVAVRSGGSELLDDFYDVFCRNMHELGTPVYPVAFFRAILERFADNTRLVIVYRNQQPAAAGFLVHADKRAEIPWASCRSDAKPLGFNMRLYWEALTTSIALGCTSFDFGRSTIDSGTYRFKKQWGAEPVQLHWHRWERRPRVSHSPAPAPDEQGRIKRFAVSVWQRLPLSVANALGPLISPALPW